MQINKINYKEIILSRGDINKIIANGNPQSSFKDVMRQHFNGLYNLPIKEFRYTKYPDDEFQAYQFIIEFEK